MFSRTMLNLTVLLIIAVIIGVSGQIFLKKGLTQIGELELAGSKSVFYDTILKLAKNYLVIFGLFLSAVAAFFWMVTLSRVNLSIGYPLAGGLFYIGIIISSWLILGENITIAQLLGITVILVGIIVLVKLGN